MKRYKYPDAKQVLVSRDIHGDYKLLVYVDSNSFFPHYCN